MSDVFDRLAKGPEQNETGSYDNWNEMVGEAPPDKRTTQTDTAQSLYHGNEPYTANQPTLETQSEPGLVRRLLGNRALMMGAAVVGAKILSDRMRNRR